MKLKSEWPCAICRIPIDDYTAHTIKLGTVCSECYKKEMDKVKK